MNYVDGYMVQLHRILIQIDVAFLICRLLKRIRNMYAVAMVMWQPSRTASLSLAGLTVWPGRFAILSVLSTQGRSPVVLLVPGIYSYIIRVCVNLHM